MFCENCGNRLGEGDLFCEKCGWKVNGVSDNDNKPRMQTVGEMAQQRMEPIKSNQEQATDKKVSKGLVIGGSIVAIVAVCVILIALNFNAVTNFWMRTFASPEKYYQYIEKKEIVQNAEMISNLYQNLFLDNADITDVGCDSTLRVEIANDAIKSLEKLVGSYYHIGGLDCLKDVSLHVNSNVKDGVSSASYKLQLGKKDVLTADMIMDIKEDTMYVRIPEIMGKYVSMQHISEMSDTQAVGFDNCEELVDTWQKVYENAPDKTEIEKLVFEYICTAIDCIDQVEKESSVLEAEAISQKCIALRAKIDTATIKNMAESILEKAKEDEKLEIIVKNMADAMNLSKEEVYEKFLGMIEESMRELNTVTSNQEAVYLNMYVDNNGKVIGRVLDTVNGDDMYIGYKRPQKGKDVAYELAVKTGYDSYSLSGTGKESGDKLSGEYTVKYNDAKMFIVDMNGFDLNKLKKGYLEGDFVFEPKKDLFDKGMTSMLLSALKVGINISTERNAAKLDATIYTGDTPFITVKSESKREKGKKVDVPDLADAVVFDYQNPQSFDVENLGISLRELNNNLKDANVPSEITGMLDMAENYLPMIMSGMLQRGMY